MQLRSTTEELDRQLAINTNIYGLNTRLVSQLERVETEKCAELRRLADQCEALRVKSETLEAILEELRVTLAQSKLDQRAQQEQIDQLADECDAHAASSARNQQLVDQLSRDMNTEIACLTSDKNAEIARLISERDTCQSQASETIARLQAEHDTSQREAI